MYLVEFFLKWEMFQTKDVAKLRHILNAQHNFPENRTLYEAMWNNTVQPERPQMTIKQYNKAHDLCMLDN
jgi:hypothetical protein